MIRISKPMKTLILIALGALTLALLAAVDPFVGTWKLNTYKSKFPAGVPRLFFATMQIESAGTGLKSSASGAVVKGLPEILPLHVSWMELTAR